MHPDPTYHWHDQPAMRDFIRAAGFGTLVCATPGGFRVAHLPFVMAGDDAVHFHIARKNIITPHLDGKDAVFIINGPHGYISPDWYGIADQVPTWNYIAVELNGQCAGLDRAELMAQVDDASAHNETYLLPKPPWSRAAMDPRRYEAMLDAIQAFEFRITDWRGTRKLGQGKPIAVCHAAAAGAQAAGFGDIATAMRAAADEKAAKKDD
jgi:transcriptional regulator